MLHCNTEKRGPTVARGAEPSARRVVQSRMPRNASPFRSEESRRLCTEWYDRALSALPIAYEERDLDTSVGRSHLVVAGQDGHDPLFLVHGAGTCAAALRD